ncbi:hypothetical protein RO3G_17143 [Rhizopus delemar RA 99-880]|uniref:Uncharacterized protein n=1 Tax=Rhizopus delemar (strain RA 99-880 / ATCC MYA-4621 / FGSC 9543 / NRRL 43880) TaxID=246409 RepID=I1CVR5_RHIO9|nr:hypothetical protein RO3G_17143 [Rhizopus delemar RA 99-880]|eukprot:EIE92545.1 hypothetical protein RO3G_17143 [Rhizopus delemar RA 99-880]
MNVRQLWRRRTSPLFGFFMESNFVLRLRVYFVPLWDYNMGLVNGLDRQQQTGFVPRFYRKICNYFHEIIKDQSQKL